MKLLFKIPVLFLLSLFLFSSCSDDDGPEPTILEGSWASSSQNSVYYDADENVLFESTDNDPVIYYDFRRNRVVEREGTTTTTTGTFSIIEQDGKSYINITPDEDLQGFPGALIEIVEVTDTEMTLQTETPFALYEENGDLKEADNLVTTVVFEKQ